MRRILIAAGGALVFLVANAGIYQKQHIVDNGGVILLELAPVDPRSLMQGDYMALRFKVMNDAFPGRPTGVAGDGRLVVALDDRGVGTFVRLDDGTALAGREAVIRYRVRDGIPRFSTDAYFFQEGTGAEYQSARFGEFRVSTAGDAILTRLRNDTLEPLGLR